MILLRYVTFDLKRNVAKKKCTGYYQNCLLSAFVATMTALINSLMSRILTTFQTDSLFNVKYQAKGPTCTNPSMRICQFSLFHASIFVCISIVLGENVTKKTNPGLNSPRGVTHCPQSLMSGTNTSGWEATDTQECIFSMHKPSFLSILSRNCCQGRRQSSQCFSGS